MLRETDEKYHQMTFDDVFAENTKPNLFAVSRVFASARKQMNLAEYKAFTFALMNVNWKEKCPEKLYFDKKTFAKIIGIKESDPTDLSQHLKRAIGQLPLHSFLEFSSEDSDEWLNGVFITSIGFFKKNVRLNLNPVFLPLFGNLDKNYITMWSEDIFRMRSKRSIKFYELLRSESDTRIEVNTGTVGIRFLKELFEIPKDGPGSYVRKSGHFNRPAFEMRVIDPLCEDLSHTDMIRLIMEPDGKYYRKIKRGNRVIAYEFHWTITMHPRVANASEKREIQEQVDADPQVMRVAKDIVAGKKKHKSKSAYGSQTANRFNDFPQRTYDYKELERQILKSQNSKADDEI